VAWHNSLRGLATVPHELLVVPKTRGSSRALQVFLEIFLRVSSTTVRAHERCPVAPGGGSCTPHQLGDRTADQPLRCVCRPRGRRGAPAGRRAWYAATPRGPPASPALLPGAVSCPARVLCSPGVWGACQSAHRARALRLPRRQTMFLQGLVEAREQRLDAKVLHRHALVDCHQLELLGDVFG